MARKKKLDELLPVFERETPIIAVYLLGSAARGSLRPDSDIDLALLPEPGAVMPARYLLELGAELTGIAERQIDIGVLSSRNLVYAHQAILTGERIYRRAAAATQADLMVATLLGMYANYVVERREVVDAYTAG